MLRRRLARFIANTPFVFLVAGLIFGSLYVFLTPPLWGVDETSHFARVYQIAHGQILPSVGKVNYGGFVPQNLVQMNDYVKSDLLDNKYIGFLRKDVDSTATYRHYDAMHFSAVKAHNLWTASYSPVAYPGSIFGVMLGRLIHAPIGPTIYLARFFTLLVYLALVFAALWVLKKSKARWIIFVLALTPVSLFQASVVTADNMAIGLSLLFVALLLRIMMSDDVDSDRHLLKWLILSGAALPLIKINYIFLGFGLFLVPRQYFKDKKQQALILSASLAIYMVLGAIWTKVINGTANAPVSQRPDGRVLDPGGQIAWLEHHPVQAVAIGIKSLIINADSYVHQMYTLVGWNFITIPIIFVFILILASLLAGIYAKDELKVLKTRLGLLNVLGLLSFISIFVALYVAFNPIGFKQIDGVQGRYFIPLLAPFFLFLGTLIPVEVRIKKTVVPYLFLALSATGLIVSLTYFTLITYV